MVVLILLIFLAIKLSAPSSCTHFLQDAVSLARTEEDPEAAARKLTEAAFTRGSADNITCIVVKFLHDRADPASPQHD